jgi:hypothetical protein
VVSNWRTVSINFNAAADIWHVEILLRVAEAVRIDNLYCGGVTPFRAKLSVRTGEWPEHHHQ